MIAIIDFDGQYVELIRTRLLEMGVNVIVARDIDDLKNSKDLKGIILSGGPYSVYEKQKKKIDDELFDLGVPILGICYGHQLLATLLGGEVKEGSAEFGFTIFRRRRNKLFNGLNDVEIVWMSHNDEVKNIPRGEIIGSTEKCKIAAYFVPEKKVYGGQFHPEVSHTKKGRKIFENFVFKICREKPKLWNINEFINHTIDNLQKTINGTAIIGLSGGIDSVTTAMLAKKANVDIHLVYIDHGFMRKEDGWIKHTKLFDVSYIDASDIFFKEVKDIIDPNKRRKIIGKLFIDIFEEEARKVNAKYLLQGTIAPDVIESTRGDKSNKGFIKIHHNVGGLPERLKLKIVEPLRPLFKYQVRLVAKKLGVPKEIISKQPYPGPGLAVRIPEKITKEKIRILRDITDVVSKFFNTYSFDQYFPYLIKNQGHFENGYFIFKTKGVGVKGDYRVFGKIASIEKKDTDDFIALLQKQSKITQDKEITRVVLRILGEYNRGEAIIIRAITTEDFMTAMPAEIKWKDLQKLGRKILEFPYVEYVGYEITTKPPSTIEII